MAKTVVGHVPTDAEGADWQSGNGTSDPVDVEHLTDVTVCLGSTVTLAGGTTVAVQVTWDGTNWVPWDSKTAIGAYTMLPACKQFRMVTSAYSAGTAVAGYGGYLAS